MSAPGPAPAPVLAPPPPNSLLRRWDGPLTRDLLLAPGKFGLGALPQRLSPDATTTLACGFCSTGCGLRLHLKDGVAIGLSPDADYPVNLGMACPKGWEALTVLKAPDRATTPLYRPIGPGGARGKHRAVPIDWGTALQTFCDRMKDIQARHGPDSLAYISTGQMVTEEMALLGSVAKFGMGVVHGDGNTRQCMATSVVAYKQAFGFDAPPYTYQDFEESDVIVLVGSNLCIAHPIMWERVMRNKNSPKIIVVDPRKTETAMAATEHLALAPKSDLTLLQGLAHILIREGWINKDYIDAHTTGFDAMAAFVKDLTPERVAAATGLDQASLLRVAKTIAQGQRVSFWWTMGVNQSHEGVRTAQAIINLALITGNMGRPGTGANSITGQCNAMGSRLFSNTTNLLGGRDFTNPADRAAVGGILGIDPARIPDRNSWAYNEILEAAYAGKVKGLWIIATNTAHSWINQQEFHRLAERLEFLVVQDMYANTETAALADLVLPAAGWGEKEGTFINSERRYGLSKKIAKAPGQALTDFSIFKLIAEAWGCGDMFRKWDSPEATFQILKELSAGRPCDITGVRDYQMIDACGGVQWPYTAAQAAAAGQAPPEQQRRLFADGRYFTPDGKAKMIVEASKPPPEPVCEEYPYVLLTGRGSASQWHTQTRTRNSAVLRKLYPQDIYVEINSADAHDLGIHAGDLIHVASRRGSLHAKALLTPTVKRKQVFIPMHYEACNRLTYPVFDPYSKQPGYKHCAVQIRKLQRWEIPAPGAGE